MKECAKYERWMAGRQDLTDEEREEMARHLTTCESCTAAYSAYEALFGAVEFRQRIEPKAAFWDGFYGRTLARIAAEDTPQTARRRRNVGAWIAAELAALVAPPRWVWQTAVAVVLVGAGVFVGRLSIQDRPVPPNGVVEGQQTALAQRTTNYLNRSKVLLLGLVHFDPKIEDPRILNLPRSREVASELVRTADGLKADLSAGDQRRLYALVSDLEVILLQIANLESTLNVPSIEMVQSGVDRKALLFKINVEELYRDARSPGRTRLPTARSPSI